MKAYPVLIAIVLYILLYIFTSCGKYPTNNESPYGETILSNNLKIIDNMNGIELFKIDTRHVYYTFTINTNYSDSIQTGDIIIGTAFGGYIRRVTGLTIYPQELMLKTEYATLADAIVNGGIDTVVHLTTGTGSKKDRAVFELISSSKGVSLSEQGIDLSGLSLYSGNTEGVSVDVDILDGFISFDPTLEYGFAMNSNGLNQFHTFIGGDLIYDYDMEISSDGKFGMTGLNTIAEFQYNSIQMFGTLPILEVINLKFDIGFNIAATIDGTFLYGVNSEYNVKAGAQLFENNWSEVWTKNTAFEEMPLSWPGRGETHIQSYIRPKVDVSFYSVIGSQVSLKPYTNFDANVENYPSWCWELNNGIEGTYGFQLHQFGHEIANYSQNLDEMEWSIASDCEDIEDMTPPSGINDLSAENSTFNSISLSWTSTGDDAEFGKASEYDVRYLKSPIDITNWSLATKCSPTPNPRNSGNREEYNVTGLSPVTKYYFAVKVGDEVPNWSPISNIVSYTTNEVVDVIPPSAVNDLFAGTPTANSMTLTWTAPGDDDYIGKATKYDIRVSTEYISTYEWNTYVACPNVPTPSTSGNNEEYIVTNLVPNTIYYFAIKSADEVLNWSDMSNMAGERTSAESGRGDIIDEFPSPTSSYCLDMAATLSSLWIIDHSDDTVYNVNLSDGTLNNKFNFAPNEWTNLQGITYDGNYLWIATRSDIHKVNPENGNSLGQFNYDQTIGLITGLTWGDGKLWLAGPFIDKAYEIDTDRALIDGDLDSSVTNQVSFADPSLFRGIMFYDDGLFISSWTNSESATVYEYDPSSGDIRQQFQIKEYAPTQRNPIQGGLATDGTNFYTGGDNLRILKIRY